MEDAAIVSITPSPVSCIQASSEIGDAAHKDSKSIISGSIEVHVSRDKLNQLNGDRFCH